MTRSCSRCRMVRACRAEPARSPSVPRSSLSSQAITPRPRTLPMVAAQSTVAVVLCTPPFGFAKAITRGLPRSWRSVVSSASASAWAGCHSIRPSRPGGRAGGARAPRQAAPRAVPAGRPSPVGAAASGARRRRGGAAGRGRGWPASAGAARRASPPRFAPLSPPPQCATAMCNSRTASRTAAGPSHLHQPTVPGPARHLLSHVAHQMCAPVGQPSGSAGQPFRAESPVRAPAPASRGSARRLQQGQGVGKIVRVRAGKGDHWPVEGCSKESDWACSHCRARPSRADRVGSAP